VLADNVHLPPVLGLLEASEAAAPAAAGAADGVSLLLLGLVQTALLLLLLKPPSLCVLLWLVSLWGLCGLRQL
jgi:hypothetical protein